MRSATKTRPVSFARVLAAGALVALASAWPAPSAALTASKASDICASNANPCNVTQSWDILKQTCSNALTTECATNADCSNGGVCKVVDADLDFGTRAVNVTGAGQFNFGTGSGSVRCGSFTATTTGNVIDANGPTALGSDSGTVRILARRQCTDNTPNVVPCVDLSDCQLGACNTRRCEFKSTKTCLTDDNCDLGTCGANKRCTGSATIVRCNSNADCQYGSCLAQLTCSNKATDPVSCSTNADCDFGTCTVGTASITLGGGIIGNSDGPAFIELAAADNVSISKNINLNSTRIDVDGGELLVEAAAGSINLAATISATGGSDGTGGSVDMTAGLDIVTADPIDVAGGDFDGGTVDMSAGRDLTIGRDLTLSSVSGAGFGGDLTLEAGRDITVNGISSSNKTIIQSNGHTDATNFAGDGGSQEILAGRNIALNVNTRILGNGSAPDGSGSDLAVDALGDLVVGGDLVALAQGSQGSGGTMTLSVGGTTTIAATGGIDASGGDGGLVEVDSVGNTTVAGLVAAGGALAGGFGGDVFLSSQADTTVSGTLQMKGSNTGSIEVDACRITLASTGKFDNGVINGSNKLVVNESMKLLSGSSVSTGGSGTNRLVYRTQSKPPQTSGTISPAPVLQVDGNLPGCPVCGNQEIDKGETCDDGNTNNGDGCSSACQNENCLQQTIAPGYPTVPLCEDGNVCTADVCNTSLAGGTCQHPSKDCTDEFSCTSDSCNPQSGVCEHEPNDLLCNDLNGCTNDFCTAQSGCGASNNSAPCDDQDECTENDTCAGGICTGTTIQGCGVCGDGEVNAPEQCDDGNATFSQGEYCGVGCVLIPCGKPTNSSGTLPKSSDALFVLKAAVGQVTCSLRVCDVDNSTKILTSDALRVLRKAVGQVVTFNCPTS